MTRPDPPAFPTVGAALEWAHRELTGSDAGPLEARALLAHLQRQPACWVLAHPELPFPPHLSERYIALIRRVRTGEPLPYLTGVQEFHGLEFEVTPDVLIPRPETELLVDTALAWLAERPAEKPAVRMVDVGTGSGCIAAVLAMRRPDISIIATDISPAALAVAARNFARHGVGGRIRTVQADLLAPLRGPIDLLCANLPYCLSGVLEGLPVIRWEPRRALDGGADGLGLIRRALIQSAARMAGDGVALFEIDAAHAAAARELAGASFPRAAITAEKDLAGADRLLVIRTIN